MLVVDAANVVGSRPDGWWRDRAGAAARLHSRLLGGDTGFERIILVVEGQARPGVPAGSEGPVETVHAAADGDATIVDISRELIAAGLQPVVVTADRALAAEVTSSGGEVVGPIWLLDRLPG